MLNKPLYRILLVIITIGVLAFFVFRLYFQTSKTTETAPTPVLSGIKEESKLYKNVTQGYNLLLPKDYEVNTPTANETIIIAPGEGPNRGIAWIDTDPANGRTADQVVKTVIEGLGEGFNIKTTAIKIDGTQAIVADSLPGQDPTRQLFMVHGDLLYRITFSPDDPRMGKPYEQMEEVYKIIVSTFRFTK